MLKKFLFFIGLCHLMILTFCTAIAQGNELIPLKKPAQTKEETKKKLLIDILKPLPKPIIQTKVKKLEEKIVVKKKKKSNFIYLKKNL